MIQPWEGCSGRCWSVQNPAGCGTVGYILVGMEGGRGWLKVALLILEIILEKFSNLNDSVAFHQFWEGLKSQITGNSPSSRMEDDSCGQHRDGRKNFCMMGKNGNVEMWRP